MTDSPNPERRSSPAMWCLALGMALLGVAWLFGFGGAIAAAIANRGELDPNTAAWLPAFGAFTVGFILSAVGLIWVVIQVIADARSANASERYRDVER